MIDLSKNNDSIFSIDNSSCVPDNFVQPYSEEVRPQEVRRVQPTASLKYEPMDADIRKVIIFMAIIILAIILLISSVCKKNKNKKVDIPMNNSSTYTSYSSNRSVMSPIYDTEEAGGGTPCISTGADSSYISLPTIYTTLDIEPLPVKMLSIPKADILTYSGHIDSDHPKDTYWVESPCYGRISVTLSGVHSGSSFRVAVYNSLDECLDEIDYAKNGDNLTVKAINANEKIRIVVRQYGNECSSDYTLTVGLQKQTVDVTGYSVIQDSLEYNGQRNCYSFTVPIDGRYNFQLSGMQAGTEPQLIIFDTYGEKVDSIDYARNSDGITVKGLVRGETYEIQVRDPSEMSNYELNIGYAKETPDIYRYTCLSDSVEFDNQRNVYLYHCDDSGKVTISLSDVYAGANVDILVFDKFKEEITSNHNMISGDTVVFDAVSGNEYQIQVRQASGYSSYKLKIQ